MSKTEAQEDEIRIIITGASRSGKSTAANVLLGKNIFQVSADTRQVSHMTCQFGVTKTEHGFVKVLDTPDILAPKLRDESRAREEIQKWKTMCPDPHLVLVAIRCDTHDLDADVMRFNKFRRLWGDNLRRHLVVLFTFGDKLQKDIDELLARSHPTLQDIMVCAGHRYVIFDSSLGANKQEGRVHQVFNFINELRQGFNVMIIGKTKSGKSSLGNYLLNTTAFSVSRGLTSSTTHAVTRSAEVDGVAITVTETPDVVTLGIDKTSTDEEIKKWHSFHPDIILLAVRCDVSYSAKEHQIYQQIKKVLGEKYLTSILIVAFTFGDRLVIDIDEELKTVCSELRDVLKEAGHRYIVFSNEDPAQDRKNHFMRLRAFVFNDGAAFECNERHSESTIAIQPAVQGASKLHDGDMQQPLKTVKVLTCETDLQSGISAQSYVDTSYYQGYEKEMKGRSTFYHALDDEDYNLVLFGKTGSGKSSLGNTLLGQKVFTEELGMKSGTQTCNWKQAIVDGVHLKITDLPGLSDTHVSQEVTIREIARGTALISPGPHVAIFVIAGNRRFTKEEMDAYETIKSIFTENICSFMIIAFTHVDSLNPLVRGRRKEALSNAIQQAPGSVQQILKEVDYRFIAIENSASEKDKRQQRSEALQAIRSLYRKNQGKYYAIPQEIERLIEKAVEDKAKAKRCSMYDAEQNLKEEIAADKQPELVEKVEKEAKRRRWKCEIM